MQEPQTSCARRASEFFTGEAMTRPRKGGGALPKRRDALWEAAGTMLSFTGVNRGNRERPEGKTLLEQRREVIKRVCD
jgi:hypothetical protein